MTSSSAWLVPCVSGIWRMGGDAQRAQHQREMPRSGVAERIPVFEQIGAVLAREHIDTLADAGLVEPRIRQPRAARQQRVLVRLQQPADEPDQFLVALVVVGWRGMRRVRMRRRGGSIEAGTAPRLQVSSRPAGRRPRPPWETADIVTVGEVADGRQFCCRAADADRRSAA